LQVLIIVKNTNAGIISFSLGVVSIMQIIVFTDFKEKREIERERERERERKIKINIVIL